MGKHVLFWEPCYSLGKRTIVWVVRKVRKDYRIWFYTSIESWWIDTRHLFLAQKNKKTKTTTTTKNIHTNWKVNFQGGRISPNINYAWGNFAHNTWGKFALFVYPLLLGLMHRRSTFIKQQINNKQTNKMINDEMKEPCQLCGTRVRLSEIKHVLVGFTLLSLLQVFHVYAEKVHIQSF